MADISEFVPGRATADEWRRYHVFRRQQSREWRPKDPIAPDEVAATQLRHGDPSRFEYLWLAAGGDEVVSELETDASRPESPDYETNKQFLYASIYVLEAHRRRGIGRAWLPTVLALMDRLGTTILTGPAEDAAGHAFLRGLGAEPRMTERESRLDLGQVDWDMVARWVREGQEASPGARLEIYPGRVPDEVLAEYTAAATELMNTIPFEDLDHGDIVSTPEMTRDWYERLEEVSSGVHTAVIRDADGAIVAMTDVVNRGYEPGLVRQNFTGVHPRMRGRRMGRWLKAAMLHHVRETDPDTVAITTENAGSNRWMLAINEALGFRPERVVTYYQLSRDRLAEAIAVQA
jgi:mycothiol synthase